jgi:hypothetical protein
LLRAFAIELLPKSIWQAVGFGGRDDSGNEPERYDQIQGQQSHGHLLLEAGSAITAVLLLIEGLRIRTPAGRDERWFDTHRIPLMW